MKYKFDCGCEYNIIGDAPPGYDIPLLDFSIKNIDQYYNCISTWQLISDGLTKGVFQLESGLGKKWSKRLKPECMEHLSGLTAILRPSCLNSVADDGVSLTEHYCRRKNKEEEITVPHESLEKILENTFGICVFQENLLRIATELAGFNLQDADYLRKSIGKKNEELMAQCREMFFTGADRVKVINKEIADEIFGWIRKASRYCFVKAHAVSYGLLSFDTAYTKTHWPVPFYISSLRWAKEKPKFQKEIAELVVDAKHFDIEVLPPDLRDLQKDFYFNGKTIRYGLTNVKNLGATHYKKIKAKCEEVGLKPGWYNLLCTLFLDLGSTARHIIACGAVDFTGETRQKMLFDLSIIESLSQKEREWVGANYQGYKTLSELLEHVHTHSPKRREFVDSQLKLLAHPPTSLVDSPDYIISIERELLGLPITVTPTSQYGVLPDIISIKDFNNGSGGNDVGICANIDELKIFKIKNGNLTGQMMARLVLSDDTGKIDVPIFPKTFENYKHLLDNETVLCFYGRRDKKNLSQLIPNHIVEMEFDNEQLEWSL